MPALGLMQSQSMPPIAGSVPLLSTATRNPRSWSASTKAAIELKHRLPAGDHHEPAILAFAPGREHMIGELGRVRELAAALPIRPDEIGVAEIALRRRPVPLPAGPEIAAGEPQEYGAAARLHALALQGEEAFLDGIAHGAAA